MILGFVKDEITNNKLNFGTTIISSVVKSFTKIAMYINFEVKSKFRIFNREDNFGKMEDKIPKSDGYHYKPKNYGNYQY